MEKELAGLNKGKVTTMIMGDLSKMRPTYLLQRGHYEHPKKDEVIKAQRAGVPATDAQGLRRTTALGSLNGSRAQIIR